MEKLPDQLTQFGLSEKSAAAYVAVLQLGEANPHQIAKTADIERTTIYSILEELADMQLISKSIRGKRLTYCVETPMMFRQLVQRQATLAENLIPILLALQGKKQSQPVVRFYSTRESIKQALWNTLECQEGIRRDFASVENIVEFLGRRFIHHEVEERVRRKIHVRSLRCISHDTRSSEQDWFLKKNNNNLLREVRYLPSSLAFSPVIFLHDDIVTVISSKAESFALVVQSQELANALKILFDITWKQAKKSSE